MTPLWNQLQNFKTLADRVAGDIADYIGGTLFSKTALQNFNYWTGANLATNCQRVGQYFDSIVNLLNNRGQVPIWPDEIPKIASTRATLLDQLTTEVTVNGLTGEIYRNANLMKGQFHDAFMNAWWIAILTLFEMDMGRLGTFVQYSSSERSKRLESTIASSIITSSFGGNLGYLWHRLPASFQQEVVPTSQFEIMRKKAMFNVADIGGVKAIKRVGDWYVAKIESFFVNRFIGRPSYVVAFPARAGYNLRTNGIEVFATWDVVPDVQDLNINYRFWRSTMTDAGFASMRMNADVLAALAATPHVLFESIYQANDPVSGKNTSSLGWLYPAGVLELVL
nr:hypothetical protein [Candidatus Sigynarchaeota archaeon]